MRQSAGTFEIQSSRLVPSIKFSGNYFHPKYFNIQNCQACQLQNTAVLKSCFILMVRPHCGVHCVTYGNSSHTARYMVPLQVNHLPNTK